MSSSKFENTSIYKIYGEIVAIYINDIIDIPEDITNYFNCNLKCNSNIIYHLGNNHYGINSF